MTTQCKGETADRKRVWAYSYADGWSRTDDPVDDCGENEDYDQALRRAGFTELVAWPSRDNTLWLQVFEGPGPESWLLSVNTVFSAYAVRVFGLPSLLDLLGRLTPLLESGDRLDVLNERHETELEERRAARRPPDDLDRLVSHSGGLPVAAGVPGRQLERVRPPAERCHEDDAHPLY